MSVAKSTSDKLIDSHYNYVTTIPPYTMYDRQSPFSNEHGTTHLYNLQTPFYSDDSDNLPVVPDTLRLVLAIFLFVVFFIGITGNVTVIWVISR